MEAGVIQGEEINQLVSMGMGQDRHFLRGKHS